MMEGVGGRKWVDIEERGEGGSGREGGGGGGDGERE